VRNWNRPAVADQLEARQHDVAQLGDRDVDLLEDRLRRRARRDGADRLPPHHVGKVGALDRIDELGEPRRIERLALARGRALRSGDHREPPRPLLFVVVQRLRHPEKRRVLALDVVPGAEPAVAVGDEVAGERVVAEEIAHPHHRLVDHGEVGALADEDDVGVRQHEDLPLELLDERLERVGGDADVVLAAVVGLEARQVDLHRPAALAEALEPPRVVEQQGFAAGLPLP
jgi:hypothetical protein